MTKNDEKEENMITLQNVSKRFDDVWAVNNVSLTMQEGSVFGLIGTNGAGKTTLLRMVTGIMKPDRGEILIDDKKVFNNENTEVAKVIGFYNFGAGDILELKLLSGKTEMIPFNKTYVPTINLEEGYIIVTSTAMVFIEDEEDSKKC